MGERVRTQNRYRAVIVPERKSWFSRWHWALEEERWQEGGKGWTLAKEGWAFTRSGARSQAMAAAHDTYLSGVEREELLLVQGDWGACGCLVGEAA
jgi:hypothetical protein